MGHSEGRSWLEAGLSKSPRTFSNDLRAHLITCRPAHAKHGLNTAQDKTRQDNSQKPQKSGKVPSELQFEPRSPRYNELTVLAHNEPKKGVWGRQNGSKWPGMAPGTAHGSPSIQIMFHHPQYFQYPSTNGTPTITKRRPRILSAHSTMGATGPSAPPIPLVLPNPPPRHDPYPHPLRIHLSPPCLRC